MWTNTKCRKIGVTPQAAAKSQTNKKPGPHVQTFVLISMFSTKLCKWPTQKCYICRHRWKSVKHFAGSSWAHRERRRGRRVFWVHCCLNRAAWVATKGAVSYCLFSCWSPEWSLIHFWLQFLGHSCPQNCANSYQYFDRNKPEDLKRWPTTKVKMYIKLFHVYWEREKKNLADFFKTSGFYNSKNVFLKNVNK